MLKFINRFFYLSLLNLKGDMMAKVKTQSQVRKKKKIWVQINAPKLFGSKKIGETNVFMPENAIDKTVEVNLMTLTGEMKKQNINMKFKVNEVNGNVASTIIYSYKMVPTFIKRLVRRRRDKIEYSRIFVTKDKVRLRVKPLIITASKTRGSTQTALQKKSVQIIFNEIKKLTFNDFVDQVVSFKFQSGLKNELKKIHPLKSCDIRQFVLESKQDSDAFVEIDDETEAVTEEKDKEKNEPKSEEKSEKKSEEKVTTKKSSKKKVASEEEVSENDEGISEDEDLDVQEKSESKK